MTGGAGVCIHAPNEIWSYGDQVYDLQKYITIRETMRPYTRDDARLMRRNTGNVPLFYDFRRIPYAGRMKRNVWSEYPGSAGYGARVREDEGGLPSAAAQGGPTYGTKEAFEGGQTVTVATPLDQIPLFTKDIH